MVHDGNTTNEGHYYSFIKSSHGVWYCMDDSNVSQVSLEDVLYQKAYMLFYSKKDVAATETTTRAISSFPTPPLSPNDLVKSKKVIIVLSFRNLCQK